jgi:hypothetical protein
MNGISSRQVFGLRIFLAGSFPGRCGPVDECPLVTSTAARQPRTSTGFPGQPRSAAVRLVTSLSNGYWQASHSSPRIAASIEQAAASTIGVANGTAAAACTVAFSIVDAPSVRR